MKQNKKAIIGIILLILLAAIGYGITSYVSHQREQARIEAVQQEQARQDTAVAVVRNLHTVLLGYLSTFKNNQDDGSAKGLLENTKAGSLVAEPLKRELISDETSTTDLLGCQTVITKNLMDSGFVYSDLQMKTEDIYTVRADYTPDKNNKTSSERPSVGYAEVNVVTKKIVKFDCSKQDAINSQGKANADIERKSR